MYCNGIGNICLGLPKIRQGLHQMFFHNKIVEINEGEVVLAQLQFGDNFSRISQSKLRYSNGSFYETKTGEPIRESNILGWENMKIPCYVSVKFLIIIFCVGF
jgi:hypothetical protein